MQFDSLVLSLPTRNSTIRMRVWRALKDSGCGVLRDGLYLLPAAAGKNAALAGLEAEIRGAGGFALNVELKARTAAQLAEIQQLFDRTAQYAALVHKIGTTKAGLARLGARRARTALDRLERAFGKLAQIDFYPGQGKLQAAEAIAELKRAFHDAYSGGEPRPARKRLRAVDPARYRGRTWATRKDLWVDRLASAWLIKRFIDREARFAWLERPRDRPARAVGFDFDGAQFTHAGNRVTFEVLMASFGLERDPGLAAIAASVHFLDVGGIPVADAKGLETVLRGAKEKARGDDALFADAIRIFDMFYRAYQPGAES